MGMTPQVEGITIDFCCQFEVRLKDSRISTILTTFAVLLPQLSRDFSQKVLVGFGEYSMALKKKPFACKGGNDADFIWKTKHGKVTKIHGFYRWLEVESKRNRLEKIIKYCRDKGYTHAVSHLENARPDMFTALEKRLNGKTTSKAERVMRTVNMRVNVSKWRDTGGNRSSCLDFGSKQGILARKR